MLVDQFVDRTFAREKSFFGPGCVAHVSVADPVSPLLVDAIEAAAKSEGILHTRGGSYLVMEGPQFSTRAESNLYRSWGLDVIGMTNMPEAKLAREAEICYATVAMVTDYDCWHERARRCGRRLRHRRHEGQHREGSEAGPQAGKGLPEGAPACPIGSDRALDVAIITAPEARDPSVAAQARCRSRSRSQPLRPTGPFPRSERERPARDSSACFVFLSIHRRTLQET